MRYLSQIRYAEASHLYACHWVYEDGSESFPICIGHTLTQCTDRRDDFIAMYAEAVGHVVSMEWDGYQEVLQHHYAREATNVCNT